MNRFRNAAAIAIAGLALTLTAPARSAEPLPTEESIRAVLDRGDWYEAARRIDRLIDSRFVPGAAFRPDPALDRLVGEIYASSSPGLARILLERALADPGTVDRTRFQLLLATADETLGDKAAAEAIYRQLLAAPPQGPGRRLAGLGLARLLLVDRPREALQVAAELIAQQGAPADRWEAELVASRAARILGMRAEAAAYLEQASQHAWSAPAGDAAVARVALDRAAAAGLMGDRQTLIALAAIGGSGTQSRSGRQFMRLLPECGTQGITTEDFVILELVARIAGRTRVGLIHASRPEIAAPFFDFVARTPLEEPPGQAISVMLRCATAPRAGAIQAWDNPIVEWAARNGAYPFVTDYQETDPAAREARLAAREARVGADSPLLIPLLARLLDPGDDTPPDLRPGWVERLRVHMRQLNDLLVAHHAPPDARLPAALANTLLTALSVQQSRQATIRSVRTTIEAAAADPALTIETLVGLTTSMPNEPAPAPDLKAALLAQALARLGGVGAAPDPRQRGLAVQLIYLRRQLGDEAGAAALQRQYGIAGDLCAVAQTSPRYLSSDIRAEDYPVDAALGRLHGQVGIDMTIDARGVSRDVRVVMAEPPFVFDSATLARAPTIRSEPAQVGGAARACRGQTQNVSWQLP